VTQFSVNSVNCSSRCVLWRVIHLQNKSCTLLQKSVIADFTSWCDWLVIANSAMLLNCAQWMVQKYVCFVPGTHSGSFTSQSVHTVLHCCYTMYTWYGKVPTACVIHIVVSSGNIKVSAVVSKSKCEVVPGHVVKACRGSGGIFVLILYFGTSWQRVVSLMSGLLCFQEKEFPLPFE